MGFEIGAYASKMVSARPRTIETVTEEILDIKQRVAEDFIELGQRLCEAKELLPHGEWLPWLANNVQFSERQAQKFMALARGYEANPQLAADFGSEKAFALLDLPMEEREQIAREGLTVDGKTKPASDLTKKEIQRAVKDRKAVVGVDLGKGPDLTVNAVQEYLAARNAEEQRFRDLLRDPFQRFVGRLAVSETRQDGIRDLKEIFSGAGGLFRETDWMGSAKGLRLREVKSSAGITTSSAAIERTWTEVWDHLAVLAIQEAGRKKDEPEGQLVIAGWMPGGTTPRTPCEVVAVFDLGNGNKMKGIYQWNGREFTFQKGGASIDMIPVKWMMLPPDEDEGGQHDENAAENPQG